MVNQAISKSLKRSNALRAAARKEWAGILDDRDADRVPFWERRRMAMALQEGGFSIDDIAKALGVTKAGAWRILADTKWDLGRDWGSPAKAIRRWGLNRP